MDESSSDQGFMSEAKPADPIGFLVQRINELWDDLGRSAKVPTWLADLGSGWAEVRFNDARGANSQSDGVKDCTRTKVLLQAMGMPVYALAEEVQTEDGAACVSLKFHTQYEAQVREYRWRICTDNERTLAGEATITVSTHEATDPKVQSGGAKTAIPGSKSNLCSIHQIASLHQRRESHMPPLQMLTDRDEDEIWKWEASGGVDNASFSVWKNSENDDFAFAASVDADADIQIFRSRPAMIAACPVYAQMCERISQGADNALNSPGESELLIHAQTRPIDLQSKSVVHPQLYRLGERKAEVDADIFQSTAKTLFQEEFGRDAVQDKEGGNLTVAGQPVFLQTVYRECVEALPKYRDEIITRFVKAVSATFAHTMPTIASAAIPHLRVKVALRAELEISNVTAIGPKLTAIGLPQLVGSRLGADLAIIPVFNTPSAITPLSPEHLQQWGLTAEEAIRLGTSNLFEESNDSPANRFRRDETGYYESNWHDNYDSARIACVELLRLLPIKGDIVAMPAHRDGLLIAGSDDEAALVGMARRGRELFGLARAISGIALRYDNGVWKTYYPDAGSLAERPFRELRTRTMADAYNRQVHLLQSWAAAHHGDAYVAKVLLEEDVKADQGLESVATWGRGTPSILPKTDWIAFYDLSEDGTLTVHGLARFGEVRKQLGHLLNPLSVYPERVLVRGFPTSRELRKLKCVMPKPD